MIAAPVMRKVSYTEDGARLPYSLERVEGARRLVVVFPRLAPGEVRPTFGLRRMFGDFHAHRLYFGGDEHTFIGPQRELRGLRAASRQAQATMDELGIRREDVVCLGTSAGAVGALLIGLEVGCGTIIAGAPVFDLGSVFATWERERPEGKKGVAVKVLQEVRGSVPGGEVEFLDSLIPKAAAEARYHSRIVLYTSFFDYGYLSTTEFVERYSSHPLLDIECNFGTYGGHGGVGAPFREFLQERLAMLEAEDVPWGLDGEQAVGTPG
jgi:hypothetical protein